MKLDDVDGKKFIKVLDLWCWREDDQKVELGEVQQLASVADRFQMTDVICVLEEALTGQELGIMRERADVERRVWDATAEGCSLEDGDYAIRGVREDGGVYAYR